MSYGRSGAPLETWVANHVHEILDITTFKHVKLLLLAKYEEIVQTLESQAQERGQDITLTLIELEKIEIELIVLSIRDGGHNNIKQELMILLKR